ncbi:MAG: GGDEF domain-containing protein, partial [Gammaproteobacteria bacterium]
MRNNTRGAGGLEFSPEQVELQGFSRSIAEIQWLLLVLVLLYFVAPGSLVEDRPLLVTLMIGFAATVLAFRYIKIYQRETRWKLALETWMMMLFVAGVLWHTGKSDSPLVNLFLLVIVVAGLTLGKLSTTLLLLLSAAIYFLSAYSLNGEAVFTLVTFSELMIKFAPLLLAAYLVTLLASDIDGARRILVAMAQTDELTGASNRRALDSALRRGLARAERSARPLSLLVIDADGLKPTNDRHGHGAGDRLIQLIADIIGDSLRASDDHARIGGDEFVAVLEGADVAQAREVAERIRMRVQNTAFDVDGERVECTVTIGTATYPHDGGNAAVLLQRADEALYEGKQGGGNRV